VPYRWRPSTQGSSLKTHRKDLEGEADIVLPGNTQHIRQVQREIDNAPTGSCQVGPGEHSTDEEALEDGHNTEDREENKHHARVAVRQQIPHLERKQQARQALEGLSKVALLQAGLQSCCSG